MASQADGLCSSGRRGNGALPALLSCDGADSFAGGGEPHRLCFAPFLQWGGADSLCVGNLRKLAPLKPSGSQMVWRSDVDFTHSRGSHLHRVVLLGLVLLRGG